MVEFINHNSFLISLVLFGSLFSFWYLKKDVRWQQVARLFIIALIPLTIYFSIRADSGQNETLTTLEAQLGNGLPILIEIRSPN